jgi:[ribosomal protein S18]-alanine N-acetyltransferase
VDLTDFTLRLARRGDAPVLAAMARDLVEAGLGWEYRPARIRELIDDPEAVTLVARDCDRPIGFAMMKFGDLRAHLILLAVRPTHQRRGVARQMAEWLVRSAATAGIASIHVELREQNVPALAFYRSLGFTETLQLPGYYRGRETAIRMVSVLRAPSRAPALWRPPRPEP